MLLSKPLLAKSNLIAQIEFLVPNVCFIRELK